MQRTHYPLLSEHVAGSAPHQTVRAINFPISVVVLFESGPVVPEPSKQTTHRTADLAYLETKLNQLRTYVDETGQ